MALQGQTPADAAGVGLADKNKWKALLTKAVNNTSTTSRI